MRIQIRLGERGLALLALAAIAGCAYFEGRGDRGAGTAALFEEVKKLEGRWQTPDADKDGKPDGVVVYRVTSGGSAVEETMFPGMPQEMVTVYNQDGGRLAMTHYCMLKNQPRLEAAPSAVFEYTRVKG